MKDVLVCNYAKTNETDKITNAMGKGGIANYVLETMKMPESDMQEEEKQKMDEKIQAKLKAGRKLTKEEEDYLKQTNPQLYQQYNAAALEPAAGAARAGAYHHQAQQYRL